MGFLEELQRREMAEEVARKQALQDKARKDADATAKANKEREDSAKNKEISWQKARDQYSQSGVGGMLREAISGQRAISMAEDKSSRVSAGGLTSDNPRDYFSARLVIRRKEFESTQSNRGLIVRGLYEYYVDISVREDGEMSFAGSSWVAGVGKGGGPGPKVAIVTREEWIRDKAILARTLADVYQHPKERLIKELGTRSTSDSLSDDGFGDKSGMGYGPCLPGNVLISTPKRQTQVKNLKIGDFVWTVDKDGNRFQSYVLKKVRRPAVKNHKMAHIILKDGRELFVSLGHPTIDNKQLGYLLDGELLDKSKISLLQIISYKGKYTYDILPFGHTGGYWANGILIGSTLSIEFKKQFLETSLQTAY